MNSKINRVRRQVNFGETAMKTIFITGGAGFIGSNFISYFMKKYPEYRIINFDKLTYAGNPANLYEVSNNPRYIFIKGDICNRELLEYTFMTYNVQGVIQVVYKILCKKG